MSGERTERLRTCLEKALEPERLEIEDESPRHAGHPGARGGGGHYRVVIVAEAFRDTPVRERHRAVYAALGAMIPSEIHALSIRALAPGESDGEGASPPG